TELIVYVSFSCAVILSILPLHGLVTPMTALLVSTSMISWSAATSSPGFTLISTIVASAIDSPNCGMMIGTCGINLFLEQRARFRSNQFRARPMRAPQTRMIRNRRVFGVHAYPRSIEQMKSFARDARDDLR